MISDGKEITKDFSQLNKYEVTQKGSKGCSDWTWNILRTWDMKLPKSKKRTEQKQL